MSIPSKSILRIFTYVIHFALIGTMLPFSSAQAQERRAAEVISPVYAGPTTWYVATTGSNTNDCQTPANPCLTINGAIGKASNADSVRVASGIYKDFGYQVVYIDKGITLSGGWNADFTAMNGTSTIDGEGTRQAIMISGINKIVTIDHFNIEHGYNQYAAGGIDNVMWEGMFTLSNSVVAHNTSDNQAGGITNSGIMKVINTTISNNMGGGIYNFPSGNFTLESSTVSNNIRFVIGSGITNNGQMFIKNSTISHNGGENSTGIFEAGVMEINNSTISFNQSYGLMSQGGHIALKNTIIAKNGSNGDCYNYSDYQGSITSQGYNLIGDTTGCDISLQTSDLAGTNTNPINPGLTPLQDNGGATLTHALMSGSPAIHAGNPLIPGSEENACLPSDQRGVPRPVGLTCDIGAFEGEVSADVKIISGNAGIAEATLSYVDVSQKSVIADANGDYSISVLAGWTGSVTPHKTGYTFIPVSLMYNDLASNKIAQNYIANADVAISGNVGTPYGILTYTSGTIKSIHADEAGNYSIQVPYGWSGTITPFKFGTTFTPLVRTYEDLINDISSQTYTTSPASFKDPSFEAPIPNILWQNYSANFETPLCTFAFCGNGAGTAGPRTGFGWVWFGGTSITETGFVNQNLDFPKDVPNLKLQFYFWIGAAGAGSDINDIFTVDIDNSIKIFSANASQQTRYSTYTPILVDVSAFSDGTTHNVNFSSLTSGQTVNFNLDDVALVDTIFLDTPSDYWALQYIERLYQAGITSGCGNGSYCPIGPVTRAQMAIFLLKGIHGTGFTPPAVGESTSFSDVDVNHWAAAWIKQLAEEAITGGCGNGIFCPEATVTRAQMAVFLLKAMHGASYSPPDVSATFGDTSSHWAEDWIEQLATEGITSGCGNGNYCPENPVTRDQMAVFLVKAFNLP